MQMYNDKQCKLRSDCSFRSSLKSDLGSQGLARPLSQLFRVDMAFRDTKSHKVTFIFNNDSQ